MHLPGNGLFCHKSCDDAADGIQFINSQISRVRLMNVLVFLKRGGGKMHNVILNPEHELVIGAYK